MAALENSEENRVSARNCALAEKRPHSALHFDSSLPGASLICPWARFRFVRGYRLCRLIESVPSCNEIALFRAVSYSDLDTEESNFDRSTRCQVIHARSGVSPVRRSVVLCQGGVVEWNPEMQRRPHVSQTDRCHKPDPRPADNFRCKDTLNRRWRSGHRRQVLTGISQMADSEADLIRISRTTALTRYNCSETWNQTPGKCKYGRNNRQYNNSSTMAIDKPSRRNALLCKVCELRIIGAPLRSD